MYQISLITETQGGFNEWNQTHEVVKEVEIGDKTFERIRQIPSFDKDGRPLQLVFDRRKDGVKVETRPTEDEKDIDFEFKDVKVKELEENIEIVDDKVVVDFQSL
jgi:hypothetical protein